jgi:hypothetical protein
MLKGVNIKCVVITMNTTLPENNTQINVRLFLLDPLSVIIKLAILSNKPVGTKILIQNNVIYLQEPGIFQSVCRVFFKSNKTDLQYLYNPIQIACQTYLTKEFIQKTPRIKNLFICAQNGLKKIMETYKTCTIISICLNYYYAIITNYVEQQYSDKIFYKDIMTTLYTKETIEKMNEQWVDEKIKLILDLTTFLSKDAMAMDNVKSLETIMENIDKNTRNILDSV